MPKREPVLLDPPLAKRLADKAHAQGRTADSLAAQAIETFLDWDDDFRTAVARGVSEAEAGHFASDDEVSRVFRKRT